MGVLAPLVLNLTTKCNLCGWFCDLAICPCVTYYCQNEQQLSADLAVWPLCGSNWILKRLYVEEIAPVKGLKHILILSFVISKSCGTHKQ